MSQINLIKKNIIQEIKSLTSHLLVESNFIQDEKNILIYILPNEFFLFKKDSKGKYFYQKCFDSSSLQEQQFSCFIKDFDDCYLLHKVIGFTEEGFISEYSHQYGIRQSFFNDFPVEDLEIALEWLKKYLKT